MPRAFLITRRRYNGEEYDENIGDFSPERGVRIPEYNSNQPTSDGVSDCGSESSSECPDELYNLTKLAEVSVAAAAGKLIHSKNNIYHPAPPLSPCWSSRSYSAGESSPPSINHLPSTINNNDNPNNQKNNNELSLRERTRLFFERIETERDKLESRSRKSCLQSPVISEIISRKSLDDSILNNNNNTLKSKELTGDIDGNLTIKQDENEEHECPDCGKKYSTSSNLARHRQTHRSLGDKKARRCPHCDKVYVSMPAFSMHVRTHNQGCKCHYCGKCFSRPWLLQGHIRTHTGEKPFKCTICNKAFADKSNLRAHVQTHSNTKPHVCGRCGKAFALKSYLYKHEESSCMRAHSRSVTDKKEEDGIVSGSTSVTTTPSSSLISSSSSSSSSNPSSCSLPAPPTSSPTSVIVSRPSVGETPITFSSIIQHTKSTQSVFNSKLLPKKRGWGNDDDDDRGGNLGNDKIICDEKNFQEKSEDIISRVSIIRSSVISTNPEHKLRRNSEENNNLEFNFTDSSAFSRGTGMNVSLAIA